MKLIIGGKGRVVKLKGSGVSGRVGGGKRGQIKGFSRVSRVRMIEAIRSLDFERLREEGFACYFATGTYQADLSLELLKEFGMAKFKEHLRAIVMRFTRALEGFFFWKLEFTKRGVPHFHFLFFVKLRQWEEMVAWFSRVWIETFQSVFKLSWEDPRVRVMGISATNVRWVPMNREEVVAVYTTKEVGKTFQTETSGGWTGRFWGIVNRKLYNQFRVVEELPLSKGDFYKLRRWLVNLNWSKGYKVKIRNKGQGVKDLFTLPDTAKKFLSSLTERMQDI